ncbi:MAG: nuclear transport factor 2 family protein [Mucilaginibacter sp.]|nr:nuclear transport factor 2 family protein [Mucilaginibacter sp.]
MLWTITCLSFLFIGYESNGQSLSAIKKEIRKDNALYFDLFKKSDPAIVNLYTDDACLLPPNAGAICGKAALAKDFKDTYAAGQVKGVKFSTLAVYGDGALYVTEEGSWQVFGTNDQVIDKGKYLKLWKKTKQGWKIFRDVFNSDHKRS